MHFGFVVVEYLNFAVAGNYFASNKILFYSGNSIILKSYLKILKIIFNFFTNLINNWNIADKNSNFVFIGVLTVIVIKYEIDFIYVISLEYNNDDYNIEKIQNFSTETFQNLDMENNYIEMCTYQCNYQFLDDNIYNTNHLPQDINLDSPMLNSPFSPDTNNFMIYQDSDNDDSKIDFNNKDIFNF